MRTQFGTTDKTGVMLRNFKLTPSIAYQVSDKWSVGATLALTYSDAQLAVLPNTPAIGWFEAKGNCNRANGLGMPGSCAYAINITPKIGAMYKPNQEWTFGIAYTFKTMLPYSNGRLTRDVLGVGKVNYDVDVSGMKWADDLAVGVAYRPTKALLVAVKFQWINWDAAMNNITLNLKNGDNPLATTGSITLQYNWRDQYVTAIGATYDLTDRLNIRGGYNFGNNPVPKTTMDPINANIVEHHLNGGFAYWLDPDVLRFETTFSYAFTNAYTYDSAIYGNNSRLEAGGYQLTFTLSYRPATGFGFGNTKLTPGG